MVAFDTSESLTPFRDERGAGNGAILFDGPQLRQAGIKAAEPGWFDPRWWGDRAKPVSEGGRGGAWFVEGALGDAVLRQYLRGGFAARFSRDRHLWRGPNRTRSFVEFRLLRELRRHGLPVPMPLAAIYWREDIRYRAAILLERLPGVRALAARATTEDANAPWAEAGAMVARFHRAGLDHVDLNANNLLFDDARRGWMIDFDRCRLRVPATDWREANLLRLERSLLKLRGSRSVEDVGRDMAVLRAGYDAQWQRGS